MELLKTILAVGSGSFLGGAGRYLVSLAMKDISEPSWLFPYRPSMGRIR